MQSDLTILQNENKKIKDQVSLLTNGTRQFNERLKNIEDLKNIQSLKYEDRKTGDSQYQFTNSSSESKSVCSKSRLLSII